MSTAPSTATGLSLASLARRWRAASAESPSTGSMWSRTMASGVLLGHLLDVDAALGRQHQQVLLGRAVEREAGVVLLGDVGGVLDPQPLARRGP